VTRILFLPLALAKSLQGRTEPLPLSVAARQIPRQLAELVAGHQSLHASYMPLVGNDEGRRGYVGFEDLVPLEQLHKIFAPLQQTPDLVVDGLLEEDHLQLRVSSPETAQAVHEMDVPFSPMELQALLNRLVMELWDIFDLPGRPEVFATMDAEAFSCFLAARDEELAAQANLTRPGSESAFVPFLAGLQHEPGQERILNALIDLARLYIEQGRGDAGEACQALAYGAESGEPPLTYLASALRLVRQAGNLDAVRRVAKPYLRQKPTDADTALLAGAAHWSQEDPQGTRDVLESTIAQWTDAEPSGPSRAGAIALLYEALRALGEREAQAAMHARLRSCTEWSAHAAEVNARALYDSEEYDEAIACLEKALEQTDGDNRLHLELGRALLLVGRGEDARESLLHAIGGPAELAVQAKRLLGFVERPEVLSALESAERHLRREAPKDALKAAKQSISLAPELAEPYYVLGLCRSALGQTRRAIKALRKALELDPDLAEARNRLGILLVSLGRYDEAHQELSRVIDERPGEIGPLLHMAQACYYLKRFDEGKGFLQQAEELQPEHPLVQQTRSTFYSLP
jgi:tetratricopeptide (TPR) repeat protein